MRRAPAFRVLIGVALAALSSAADAPSASAQTPGREPAVTELPASTRAVGLGHAYQLGAPTADVVFYNPALLGEAAGSIIGGVHLLDDALALDVAAARDWYGGSVALGLQALEHGSPGAGRRPGGLDPLVREGGESVAELAATLAFARRIAGVRVGLAGKILAQRFREFRQTSGALDVGVAHDVGPVTAGLAVRNIGPDRQVGRVLVEDRVETVEAPQPLSATLGVGGYGRRVGPLDVGVAAALTLRDDGELVAGGGVEAGYWPVVGRTFVVRVGGRMVPEGDALPLTFGASYWGDDLVLAWAYQDMGNLDGVHRISVGWR